MQSILVIRNDKLGDFMLAWPAFAMIKSAYPEAKIIALTPPYTSPMAELCPWIDEVIIDDQHKAMIADAIHLSRLIKATRASASISLFSEMRTALALWLTQIPDRFGPASKLAQVFLNHRLRQKRSLSLKPEYEYNTDLIRYFITCNRGMLPTIGSSPYLKFNNEEIAELRRNYLHANNISMEKRLVFIHAGSGGSAINLSLSQFSELARQVAKNSNVHFVLTAGPTELDIVSELSKNMFDIDHSVYHSTDGIVSFSKFISICDLFVSGSTGPLHIAGALNVPTAAFYPARRSATKLRWQTLNSSDKRVSFMPEVFSGNNDMESINIENSANEITALISCLYAKS